MSEFKNVRKPEVGAEEEARTFIKGNKVNVYPIAYRTCVYSGEILRKTKHGFSVRYNNGGMEFRGIFSNKELLHV